MIEDVGTHLPTANLLGDALYHGFDTRGDTLGFSKFHLEQCIETIRRVLGATLVTGPQSESVDREFAAEKIYRKPVSQNVNRPVEHGQNGFYDVKRPGDIIVLKGPKGLETIPTTGRYRITIRATGKSRKLYPTSETGVYHGDPIQLQIAMGDPRQLEEPEASQKHRHLAQLGRPMGWPSFPSVRRRRSRPSL